MPVATDARAEEAKSASKVTACAGLACESGVRGESPEFVVKLSKSGLTARQCCKGRVFLAKSDKTDSEAMAPLARALTLAARRHRSASAIALSALGLFPGQDSVILLLRQEGQTTMGDLADALRVRPPTASKMVARLVGQGLVARGSGTSDARVVSVVLTAEGHKKAEAVATVSEELEGRLVRGMDDKDMKRLRKLLKRIARNLEDADTSEIPADDDLDL
jgi:MarR family transcriptional regulator, organic hydroperoxide resistance regulator